MKNIEKIKIICQKVLNVFETGKIDSDYSALTIMTDGKNKDGKLIPQISYGKQQVTEYGHLKNLINDYVFYSIEPAYAKELKEYIPKIGIIPLYTNLDFISLLKKSSEDPIMQKIQDEYFDKKFWTPAVNWADYNAFTQPLSMLVIYDSFIHSGRIPLFLRKRFGAKVPADGGFEDTWIISYVDIRHQWLKYHKNPILRKTIYRTKCFKDLIENNNWNLETPFFANGIKII